MATSESAILGQKPALYKSLEITRECGSGIFWLDETSERREKRLMSGEASCQRPWARARTSGVIAPFVVMIPPSCLYSLETVIVSKFPSARSKEIRLFAVTRRLRFAALEPGPL